MNDNMALMSQTEIDVLVNFLTAQKEKVTNEVMDQESIDRLIKLLRTDMVRDVKFDTNVPESKREDSSALLLIDAIGDLKKQQKNCQLQYRIAERTGYVEIICHDKRSGKDYAITPKCMEQVRYIRDDDSQWGYAVPPTTFDKISALLSVKYTKETFDMVCNDFAEKMYGSKDIQIADIYMPTAYSMIHHLCD